MFENLQFWWWSHPRFEYHRQILLSAIGLQPLNVVAVRRDKKGREINTVHDWSDPINNYYGSNPLKDSWYPCLALVSAGFFNPDPNIKTDWFVSEKGLRFLKYFANKTDEYMLVSALEKVNL